MSKSISLCDIRYEKFLGFPISVTFSLTTNDIFESYFKFILKCTYRKYFLCNIFGIIELKRIQRVIIIRSTVLWRCYWNNRINDFFLLFYYWTHVLAEIIKFLIEFCHVIVSIIEPLWQFHKKTASKKVGSFFITHYKNDCATPFSLWHCSCLSFVIRSELNTFHRGNEHWLFDTNSNYLTAVTIQFMH